MKTEEKIEALETEFNQKISELKENLKPKQNAKEWLLNYLSKGFEIKFSTGSITYYRDGKWNFQQDFKNKRLWCFYNEVWSVFETDFGMDYKQIQALHKKVVGEALNCNEFTPLAFVFKTKSTGGRGSKL